MKVDASNLVRKCPASATVVPTHHGKSLGFKKRIFQAWKLIANDCCHEMSWNSTNSNGFF